MQKLNKKFFQSEGKRGGLITLENKGKEHYQKMAKLSWKSPKRRAKGVIHLTATP